MGAEAKPKGRETGKKAPKTIDEVLKLAYKSVDFRARFTRLRRTRA